MTLPHRENRPPWVDQVGAHPPRSGGPVNKTSIGVADLVIPGIGL